MRSGMGERTYVGEREDLKHADRDYEGTLIIRVRLCLYTNTHSVLQATLSC